MRPRRADRSYCERCLEFGDRGTGKAAKGIAVVAIVVVGRVDVAVIEVEAVGVVSIRVGSRRPINTVLASVIELISIVRIDTAAPHKEYMRKLVKRSLFTISSRLSEKRSAYITNCDSLYKACSLYLSLNCDDKSRGLHDLLVRHRSSWSLTSKCSSLTRGTWFHMTIVP